MDDRELYERVRRGLARIIEFFGGAAPGSEIVRWRGVTASIVPGVPQRSLFNTILFATPAAVDEYYDELVARYRERGVGAISAWVDPGDAALAEALSARGHELDGQPIAMAGELSQMTLPEPGDLVWTETREALRIAAINEAAYGFSGSAWQPAFKQLGDSAAHAYIARHQGHDAACLLVFDGDFGDCVVAAVATRPEHQRQRLASRLMAVALRHAHERGNITSSLQSSRQGMAVYARLGYRNLGAMSLWERRFDR